MPSKNKACCLLVGTKNSGKTTLLYKMKLGEWVTTVPTVGFNVETVGKRDELTMWDIGGLPRIRPLWSHYLENVAVMIYFVSGTSTPEEIQDSKAALETLKTKSKLDKSGWLFLCTKGDLPDCMSAEDMETQLDLKTLFGPTPYTILKANNSDDASVQEVMATVGAIFKAQKRGGRPAPVVVKSPRLTSSSKAPKVALPEGWPDDVEYDDI